jgi:hypothetical protein
MKYQGIKFHDAELGVAAFAEMVEKVAKRVPPWKGKNTSSGGRLVMSNNCLTSLPMYNMGFYLLPKCTHRKMNTIRTRFFWRGVADAFKYHMVKWSAVCRSKQFGGLGIISTKILNECLLTKWIWKLYKQKNSLWVRLLTAKYIDMSDFFRSKEGQGSQFWRSLHKIKHLFKWGTIHKVGNGNLTPFLE